MGNGFESRSVRSGGGIIRLVQLTSDVADAAVTSWGTVVVKNDGTVWAVGLSQNYLT